MFEKKKKKKKKKQIGVISIGVAVIFLWCLIHAVLFRCKRYLK